MSLKFVLCCEPWLEEYYFKIFDIKCAESLLIAMPHIKVYLLLVILLIISDTLLSVKINNSRLYPGAECE